MNEKKNEEMPFYDKGKENLKDARKDADATSTEVDRSTKSSIDDVSSTSDIVDRGEETDDLNFF